MALGYGVVGKAASAMPSVIIIYVFVNKSVRFMSIYFHSGEREIRLVMILQVSVWNGRSGQLSYSCCHKSQLRATRTTLVQAEVTNFQTIRMLYSLYLLISRKSCGLLLSSRCFAMSVIECCVAKRDGNGEELSIFSSVTRQAPSASKGPRRWAVLFAGLSTRRARSILAFTGL